MNRKKEDKIFFKSLKSQLSCVTHRLSHVTCHISHFTSLVKAFKEFCLFYKNAIWFSQKCSPMFWRKMLSRQNALEHFAKRAFCQRKLESVFDRPREHSLQNVLLHTFDNACMVTCSLKRAFCQESILQGCAGEHFLEQIGDNLLSQ